MTLKEKIDEVLEDFDVTGTCPSAFGSLKGHFYKNARIEECDGDCENCWNQPYYERNIIEEIETILVGVREVIDTYEKALAIRDALEATLAKIREEK